MAELPNWSAVLRRACPVFLFEETPTTSRPDPPVFSPKLGFVLNHRLSSLLFCIYSPSKNAIVRDILYFF
jgi:hypothetical protein